MQDDKGGTAPPRRRAPDDEPVQQWGRVPAVTMRAIIDAAAARGGPWDDGAAALSLTAQQREVVLGASGASFPGYREWAKRWGWTESRARGLLRDTARWLDPKLAEYRAWKEAVSPERRGGGARTPHSPLTHPSLTPCAPDAHPTKEQPAQSDTESRTPRAPLAHPSRTSRARLATRARIPRDTSTNPSPSPDTHERAHARDARVPDPEPPTAPAPEPTPKAVAPALPGMPEAQKVKRSRRAPDADVARVWTHYRARCPERRGEAPPGYLEDSLPRAVRQFGVDKIELLIDWLAGDDERPTFLRSVGKAWKETPFRSGHLRDYVAMAEEWDARGRRTDAPTNGKKSSFQLAKEALERAIAAEGVQAMPPDVIDMGAPPPNVYRLPQREQAAPAPRAAVVGARPSWMEDPDGLDF